MTEPVAREPAQLDALDTEFESQAALQLRRGFPWLKFRGPLEQEFRRAYRDQIRGQLQFTFVLSVVCMAAFFAISHFTFEANINREMNLLRVSIVAPALLIAMIVVYSSAYQRIYSPLAQFLAPLFGITVVVEALIAARLGVSVFSAVALTIVGMYMLVGMLFYAALRTGLIVMAAYLYGALSMNMPTDQAVYNATVLVVANILGATACYGLEKAQRTNYLEARLLTEMACRDGLTGIYNRRMLDEYLDKVWQQAGRERVSVALLLIDIDHFKAYNDYYGHQAGDECLKHVARALTQCARRPLDFTARYGGEEFALVLYDARRDYVEDLTRRIHASMASLALKHPASPVSEQLTVSIGAACVLPTAERSRFGFVQLADEALYEAKGSGRNRSVIMDKEYAELSTGSFRSRRTSITT